MIWCKSNEESFPKSFTRANIWVSCKNYISKYYQDYQSTIMFMRQNIQMVYNLEDYLEDSSASWLKNHSIIN